MRGQEGVGVFDGNGNCLHMAPPPDRVPALMGDQLNSMRDAKERLRINLSKFFEEMMGTCITANPHDLLTFKTI